MVHYQIMNTTTFVTLYLQYCTVSALAEFIAFLSSICVSREYYKQKKYYMKTHWQGSQFNPAPAKCIYLTLIWCVTLHLLPELYCLCEGASR